ncbi:hypothetical protein Bca4012_055611 [Brassica carinata]|uniref:Uncharacterized protein n=1 Tax=Brassica carinata TaxID=52824 RepID=A0A8X8B3K0_BRACI|nr:hypothetical protein Bca52824_014568 [Brassica carinata]
MSKLKRNTKMTSSIVSCMFFFLLLLVLPHIDKALGAQTELHKLKETTNHPDQVTVQRQRRYFIGPPSSPCQSYQRCKRIPLPPTPTLPCKLYQRCKRNPPTPTSSKGKYGSGH